METTFFQNSGIYANMLWQMQLVRNPALNVSKLNPLSHLRQIGVIFVQSELRFRNPTNKTENPTAKREKLEDSNMMAAPMAKMGIQYEHHWGHVIGIRLLDTLMCWEDGK
jgi:hypothetical protein